MSACIPATFVFVSVGLAASGTIAAAQSERAPTRSSTKETTRITERGSEVFAAGFPQGALADSVPIGSVLASYHTYLTPAQCLASSVRSDAMHWDRGGVWGRRFTDVRVDSTVSPPVPVVREVALKCAARFSASDIEPRYLIDLARLYLIAGDFDRADKIFALRLQHDATRSLEIRARTLWGILQAYAFGTGMLFTAGRPAIYAERLGQYLDTLAAIVTEPTALELLESYDQVLQAYCLTYRNAFVVPLYIKAGQGALRLIAKYPTEQVLKAGRNIATPLTFSAIALANQVGIDSARRMVTSALKTGLNDPAAEALLDQSMERMGNQLGQAYRKAPPVQGEFRTHGSAEDVRPALGQVTVLVVEPWPEATVPLNRLKKRFGDSIHIVVIAKTRGYFNAEAPFTPAEEFALLQKYYLEYMKIDGELIVTETPYSVLPEPDGRRRNSATENDKSYTYGTMVVDRAGVIRGLHSLFIPTAEAAMEEQIVRLLKER